MRIFAYFLSNTISDTLQYPNIVAILFSVTDTNMNSFFVFVFWLIDQPNFKSERKKTVLKFALIELAFPHTEEKKILTESILGTV